MKEYGYIPIDCTNKYIKIDKSIVKKLQKVKLLHLQINKLNNEIENSICKINNISIQHFRDLQERADLLVDYMFYGI